MKLAEALLRRKELTERAAELTSRFVEVALIAPDEVPEEDAFSVYEDLQNTHTELESLIRAINETNNVTTMTVPTGEIVTIMYAIARRDILRMKLANMTTIKSHLSSRARRRYSTAETPMRLADGVDSTHFTRMVNGYAKQLRELDKALQLTNWNVDLIQ